MKLLPGLIALTLAGLICTLIAMIPFRAALPTLVSPDLLTALCCFWVIRRPDTAPMPLIFALGLVADLLLMRPVGLGALVLVLMTEGLRSQYGALRDVGRVLEWLMFTALFSVATLGIMAVMWVTFAEVPPLGAMGERIVITAMIYPLVGTTARIVFGVTRPQPVR